MHLCFNHQVSGTNPTDKNSIGLLQTAGPPGIPQSGLQLCLDHQAGKLLGDSGALLGVPQNEQAEHVKTHTHTSGLRVFLPYTLPNLGNSL